MRGPNLNMSMEGKLDIGIRAATRDDVARILELFETAASGEPDAIPLDPSRVKLTPNGNYYVMSCLSLNNQPEAIYLLSELELKRESFFWVCLEGLDRDGFDTRDRAAYFHAVVAETKDKKLIVGAATYHFKYSTWVGQVVHLGGLVVESMHRRKGVGTKIMQHLGKVLIKKQKPLISILSIC